MNENDKNRMLAVAVLVFLLIPLSWLFSCVDKDRAATTERMEICAERGERYWPFGSRCTPQDNSNDR